jgi:uncharacterized protein (DUF983 family)
MNSTTPPPAPPASGRGVFEAARGLCPRCANPTLFAGIVKFAPRCRACGLDFASFNVGDGPAAFLIFGVGGLVTALAIWLELSASPPWWLHLLLWLPLTVILTVAGLRLAKAWLLIVEYRRDAREGVLRDHP